MCDHPLLSEIDAFLARHPEIAPSTFGRKAVNDGKLIDRLRAGGDLTTRRAAKVRDFIRSHSAHADAAA